MGICKLTALIVVIIYKSSPGRWARISQSRVSQRALSRCGDVVCVSQLCVSSAAASLAFYNNKKQQQKKTALFDLQRTNKALTVGRFVPKHCGEMSTYRLEQKWILGEALLLSFFFSLFTRRIFIYRLSVFAGSVNKIKKKIEKKTRQNGHTDTKCNWLICLRIKA